MSKISIPVSTPFLTDEAKTLVMQCLDSGWISSQGAFVEAFEGAFARHIGAKYAISVTSGTAALHLALLAAGVGAGDEVIVPDLTFAATANAVLLCGAKPVLCAVSEKQWTIDIDDLTAVVSDKTKAIIPVHLYGNPADMDKILRFAERYKLCVIEDCAESLGATLNDKHMGTFGDMGCYSFFANKLLSTGEGGMVTTNDGPLAQRLRILRDHGMNPEKRYWHEVAGLNYRMTNIQAAIGVSQLKVFDEFYATRQQQEAQYYARLSEHKSIIFKETLHGAQPVNWLMSIIVDSDNKAISNLSLQEALRENGIDSRPFFYPLHIQPPYRDDRDILQRTTSLANRGLSLPTYVGLTEQQIDFICDVIAQHLSQ